MERDLKMVGPNGLEPSTSSVSGRRSNQLSYGPSKLCSDFAYNLLNLLILVQFTAEYNFPL